MIAHIPWSVVPGVPAAVDTRVLGSNGIARGPVVERFWLRPTPTFERTGTVYPPGTVVTLLGSPQGYYRGFKLFHVGVSLPVAPNEPETTASGWAALSDADVASILGRTNDVALLRSYGKSLDGKFDMQTNPAGDPAPAFTRLPVMTRIDAQGNRVQYIGIAHGPVVERFWLRPTPTFSRVGPLHPAGTSLTIMGRAEAKSGRFKLLPVGVAVSDVPGQPQVIDFGWAALSDADIASVLGRTNDAALLASYGKSFDGKLDPSGGR